MSFICAQSRKGESVMSRRRRKADYHCLDPWTAETSGKWPGSRKSPYQATAKKNTEERQKVSEVASAKPLPILGGVAGPRCSAVAHRREAVKRCQCAHRHLSTASSPPTMKTAQPLAAFAAKLSTITSHPDDISAQIQ